MELELEGEDTIAVVREKVAAVSGVHPEHQRNGQNAGNGVYEDCQHVRWTDGPLQVVDLRKGRR